MYKTYSSTQLINTGLLVFLVCTVIGAMYVGSGSLFDMNTFALTVGLIGLLVFAQTMGGGSNPLIKTVVIFFMLFVLPRLIQYQYFPTLVKFPLGAMSVSDINNGLIYVVLGTVCMLLGMAVATKFFPANDTEFIVQKRDDVFSGVIWVWVGVFLFELLSELIITFGLGLSPLAADKMHKYAGHYFVMGFRTVISLDTVILAFFTYLFILRKSCLKNWEWCVLLTIALIFLVDMAVSGSRGGILRLFLMLLPILLLYRRDRWITVPKIVTFLVGMLIFGALSFEVGGYFKVKIQMTHTGIYNQMVSGSEKSPHFNYSDTIPIEKSIKESTSIFAFFNRLGQIDYAMNVINLTPAKGCEDDYMNGIYILKSIANGLMPGNPYPEAYLNTSRLISVCYRGMTPDELLVHHGYHSEFWTSWGLALLMFGWWGGLLFMLIGGVIVQLGYSVVWRFFPRYIRPYYAILYFFIVPILFVFTMGIDHSVNTTIFFGAQLAVVLLLVNGLSWVFKRNRRVPVFLMAK